LEKLLPETVTKCLKKAGFSTCEVTASAENENYKIALMKLLSVAAVLRTTSTQTEMCRQNKTQWL
jgi:hypothetical protein